MNIVGDGVMVLRVSMVGVELAKEMLREEDCSSFLMKTSCVLQTHGLKRRSKEKQHAIWVEMKLRLIFCWLVKAHRIILKM